MKLINGEVDLFSAVFQDDQAQVTDCGVSFRNFVKLTLSKVGIDRAFERKVDG